MPGGLTTRPIMILWRPDPVSAQEEIVVAVLIAGAVGLGFASLVIGMSTNAVIKTGAVAADAVV